jgi:hypothetical protein
MKGTALSVVIFPCLHIRLAWRHAWRDGAIQALNPCHRQDLDGAGLCDARAIRFFIS